MNLFQQIASQSRATPSPETAEVKLDLCGMEKQTALAKLDVMVKQCKRSTTTTLFVCFDAAKAGGGETLFQPVARYFKFEKLNGYIAHAIPVMTAEKGGIFVTFKI